MKHLRLLSLFAAALAIMVLGSSQPGVSRSQALPDLPTPHIGYGLNVRANLDMAAGLGFDWVKLYEDIFASPADFPPAAANYHVLYRLKAEGQPFSLDQYLAHVQQLALAGRGKINAYEIGNEPNLKMFWGGQSPNPEQYGRLLCRVQATIKSVDPDAFIVSAGLAPVGRTRPQDWLYAMDDHVFAQRMFDAILAAYPTQFPCFDAFGYHPQGFPYPPEISYEQLEQEHPDDHGNDFRFRATEWFHALMIDYTIGYVPIWPTEFGWLRNATTDAWDGNPLWNSYAEYCAQDTQFKQWSWMAVSEAQQADYLVRAYQYADANMPWIGPMFVFNIDWNSQGWECDHVKFFSVYKAATGRTDTDPLTKVPSLAVQALANLSKRYVSPPAPALSVQPAALTYLAELSAPSIQTQTLNLINADPALTMTWTLSIDPASTIVPGVTVISGTNDVSVTVQIDTGSIELAGTYTASLIITASPTTTRGSPTAIPLNVSVVDQLNRIYLPLFEKNYPLPASPVTSTFGLAFVSSAETPASDDRYQHATALNATINRWPMYWSSIETQPTSQPRVYDWSKQDANIIADINHGLTSLPILMNTPIGLDTAGSRTAPAPKVGDGLWLRMSGQSTNGVTAPSSQASPPQGLSLGVFSDGTDTPGPGKAINPDNRWAYFVNAAVNRFKPGGVLAQAQGWINGQGIRNWEIWNEEDLNQFFIGTPADYARMLKVADLAAQFADPQAYIVFGGMAHYEKPTWLNDVLNTIDTYPDKSAQHGFMDAVATHNYAWAWQTFGYLLGDQQTLAAHDLSPVKSWVTETGVPVCDDPPYVFCPSTYRATMSEQADFVIQTMTYAAWLKAETSIWFNLYDDCGNDGKYDAFGLVRNPATGPCTARDGTPRVSFNAYQNVIRLLSGVQPYWRDRRTGSTTDWTNGQQEILAFKRPSTGQRVVMMWTRYYQADTATLTATSSSALLILPDGTSSTIYPTNGVYTINLPAATNAMTPTTDGTAPIGGSPRIVVENDPAVTP